MMRVGSEVQDIEDYGYDYDEDDDEDDDGVE